MQQLMLLSEEPPANPSASPDCGRDSKIPAANSCLPILQSLHVTGLDGLSGKTSPVSCHPTEDGILVPSSGRWGSWGMGGPTESWTLNGSESPSAAVVCSLSDVLETQPVQQKYFLSPKACAGILRRAENRGKKLPDTLYQALQAALTPNAGGGEVDSPERS